MPRRAGLALSGAAAAVLLALAAAGTGRDAGGAPAPAPPAAAAAPAAFYRASLPWPRSTGITGLSAIAVTEGGAGFVAVSDRGRIATGRIRRDAEGRPVTLAGIRADWLRGPGGGRLAPGMRDAEGLAIGPGGRISLSFEGPARVWAYAAPGAAAEPLPLAPGFAALPLNEGFEGLAIDPAGRLVALPETAEDAPDIPLWRLEDGAWRIALRLAPSPGYRPVAADFGPDGRFYLLERAVSLPFGFRARLRRFDLGSDPAGRVLIDSAAGTHGNLEGLSVWRDGQGRLVATMVSDDNESRLLRAELVEYLLPD